MSVIDDISRMAIDKNEDGDYGDRDRLRAVRNAIEKQATRLFVIEQVRSDQQRHFWNCSTAHGCGWSSDFPKQSFSKSELVNEIYNLIDRDLFSTIVIRELYIS